MAGLFLRHADLGRLAAIQRHLHSRFRHRLRAVPPVRHLEALAGELGRPESQRWPGGNDRRHDRRTDGGRGRRSRPLFPAHLMFSPELLARADALLAKARAKGLKIVTAESCTGGLIAGLLTEIPGSSDVVERGFVTYSNEAKEDLLGVPSDLIHRHGAVSAQVC